MFETPQYIAEVGLLTFLFHSQNMISYIHKFFNSPKLLEFRFKFHFLALSKLVGMNEPSKVV
jgi:hypothetical protein